MPLLRDHGYLLVLLPRLLACACVLLALFVPQYLIDPFSSACCCVTSRFLFTPFRSHLPGYAFLDYETHILPTLDLLSL